MSWEKAWSYLPVNYNVSLGKIKNITQRSFFENNITGNRVKIKFSNKYSKEPLVLEKVVLTQLDKEQNIENKCVITCQKKQEILLEAGEEFYSDEIEYSIKAGNKLALYIFIKEANTIQSACATWSTGIWNTRYKTECQECCFETSDSGWKESKEIYSYIDADSNKADIIAGVSEILIDSTKEIKRAALFGDSITHMSYFADALTHMIFREFPETISIANYGIGGNRVLRNASVSENIIGNGACFGEAGIKRFERDVFSQNTPDYILFLEGINDIMHPYEFDNLSEKVTSQELSAGIEKIIDIAHRHGSKIYVGTIMPFMNETKRAWENEAEEIRMQVNDWIRKKSQADEILDYDKKMEDQQKKRYLCEENHIGDGLHPNEAGGKQMAEVAFKQLCMEIRSN